jgi:hypothetical protein
MPDVCRAKPSPALCHPATTVCRAGTTHSHRDSRDETETRPGGRPAPAVRRPPATAIGNIVAAPLDKPTVPFPHTSEPETEDQQQEEQPKCSSKLDASAAAPPPASLAAVSPSVCGLHAVPLSQQSPVLTRITAHGAAGAFPPPATLSPPPVPIPGHELAEIVVGRVALAGVVGVEAVRVVTGMGLAQQVAAFGDNAVILAIIVLAASLVTKTLPKGRGVEVRIVPLLSLRAEKLVGRLAMVVWAAEVAAAATAWLLL